MNGVAGHQPLVFELSYDRWCGGLLALLGLGRRRSRVVIDDELITVRMGWGFRARLPLWSVRSAGRVERPFFGWGVHGWRGRWLVNGSSAGLVAIEIDPPARGWTMGVPLRLRTVFVSLADPDGFQAALGAASRV